jgi:hypothetical protein
MAHASTNFWGIVISLDHQETQDVISVATSVADIANRIGGALSESDLAVAGFALQAIAFGISANAFLVEKADQGHGVYLTSPWVALGTVIPSTYPADVGLPADWVARGSGEFRTEDSPDLVAYEIQLGAIGPEAVEFQIEATDTRMWRKVLVLRDGLGGQWDITIDPSQGTFSGVNGLWADQVHNGQVLSLWKAKQFGINTWVLDIGGLEALQPGSRAVFRWLTD